MTRNFLFVVKLVRVAFLYKCYEALRSLYVNHLRSVFINIFIAAIVKMLPQNNIMGVGILDEL